MHMNNILIDTNVLVYAIDADSKFHVKSKSLVENESYNLFTTSKNLSELLVVLTRGPKVSIKTDSALKIILNLSTYLNILYPTPQSFKRFQKLLLKYRPVGLHIHDFEIVSIALSNNVSMIATFDKSDFKSIKEIELFDI